MQLRELAARIGASVEGDADREVLAAAPLETATSWDISFVGNRKAVRAAETSAAGSLVVPLDFVSTSEAALIRAKDPRTTFAGVVRVLHPRAAPPTGIHPTAVVAPTAVIMEGASIGPHCTIGEASVIGHDTVLAPGVTIYDGVTVGDRCILHAGCVLGADGFGFVFERGRFEKFPQVGKVVIGNDVEIGANSTVDRAALGETVIGEGSKLDNMVHVGHNCRIGKHVVIAAQTGMAGGTVIEDYAVIGGQVGLGDNVRIESGAILGSGSGVLSSKIVRRGQPMWGTPARPLKEYLRSLAHLSQLDELKRRVRALEAKLK